MHPDHMSMSQLKHPPQWLRYGAILLGAQFLVAVLSLSDFILARKYLAFYDIGSDTFFQFVPATMDFARKLANGWPSLFSFEIGLGVGGSLAFNPFALLNAAFGPDMVLHLRVWVYLLKLVLGGGFLFIFLLTTGRRPLTAAVMGLAYTFCGSAVIDGQWDGHATELVFYPLFLLGIALFLRNRNVWVLPLAIALAANCGVFIFSIGVFLVAAFAATLLTTDDRASQAKRWALGIFPLALLGLAIAGPTVGLIVVHMLDSPRVTGTQALTSSVTAHALGVNDALTLFTEIAGFFHKDLLGIGNSYQGWMNYLEGPGFFVGLMPLLLIPQLSRGIRTDRVALLAGGTVLALFIIFPALRFAAFGFALPYFRVNNLWICLLLLLMAARGLDLVLERGVNRVLLLLTGLVLGTTLLILWWQAPSVINLNHLWKILGLLVLAAGALFVVKPTERAPAWQPAMLLVVTALTAAWVSYPSFNTNRHAVTPRVSGYNDSTLPALELIQEYDKSPFYRIEKTFDSVSFCDALAQGYYGVKSYWFQGSSMVRLYSELDLIPRQNGGLNYTNWLPNFGERFPLYSLVGVKYMISRTQLDWPGFRSLATGHGVHVYQNEFAMPLGVVYEKQVLSEQLKTLPGNRKDLLLLHAAIVDTPLGSAPQWFDPGTLDEPAEDFVAERYLTPAARLQRSGVNIGHFSGSRIAGSVLAERPGILVFSIPFTTGWTIAIDGIQAPIYPVNYGFLGTPIGAGAHQIELRYRPPGEMPGLLLSGLGLITLLALSFWKRRSSG